MDARSRVVRRDVHYEEIRYRVWTTRADTVSTVWAVPNTLLFTLLDRRLSNWSRRFGMVKFFDQANEGCAVDALAPRGDEGRGYLR